MSFPDLTITSLETINAFDVVSGAYKFTLDELQNASIAQTQDKVDMTGKGGRKLNSLKRNKAVTISGSNGMVSGGLLEMQTGGEFESENNVMQAITPTFSALTGYTIYSGTIESTQGEYKVLYFACDQNTAYNVKGNSTIAYSGWTNVTPANGVTVYGWTNSTTNHTFETGDDAAYIAIVVQSSESGSNISVSKIVNTGFPVAWTDYLTVTVTETSQGISTCEATTTYTAVGTAGQEITGLYIRGGDGTLGSAFEQVASNPSAGEFTYNLSNKKITLKTDRVVSDSTEIVVFYTRNVIADRLIDYSDVFSGKAALYIDALAEDKCANIYRVQFYIPKADFNGEFTFDMGDNQTVHSFEADALAGACGTAGQLWTYTVFGIDTEDA